MTPHPETTGPGSRQLWEAVERFHQLCYLAPEVRQAGTDAGLKGFWMNYFATRAAPMGPVSPETVEAVFFYYSPRRVRRAIPDAWEFANPTAILEARFGAMNRALHRILGDHVNSDDVVEALSLVNRGVVGGETLGRPLFAAWRALAAPEQPHLALWHATTVSREYRSGCHLLALGAHGLDGCEAIVSHVAVDQAPQVWITEEAAWSDDETAAATRRLIERSWIHADGTATKLGHRRRSEIETLTDELDERRWVGLDSSERSRLVELMNALTVDFPPDDQLDWRTVYGPNPAPR